MDIPKVFKSFIEVLSLMNNKSNLEQHLERTDQTQQQLNKRPSQRGIDDLGVFSSQPTLHVLDSNQEGTLMCGVLS